MTKSESTTLLIRIDRKLGERMKRQAEKERRTLRTKIEMALERDLSSIEKNL